MVPGDQKHRPQARLIHLATHGVMDAENPLRSYLAMADGRLETWILFRDIAGADLIVLHACDTKLDPRAYMARTSSDESSITGFILRWTPMSRRLRLRSAPLFPTPVKPRSMTTLMVHALSAKVRVLLLELSG